MKGMSHVTQLAHLAARFADAFSIPASGTIKIKQLQLLPDKRFPLLLPFVSVPCL